MLNTFIDVKRLKRRIVESIHNAGGGHYGGTLSAAELLTCLYYQTTLEGTLSESQRRTNGGQLILSKGHACVGLYAILEQRGVLPTEDLDSFGSFRSRLQGHPDMTLTPGIDFSTGSLGQGLSVGLGMAIAIQNVPRHVWVLMGDGECQEGQVWEAARLASRYGVPNLTAVVDCNHYQECEYWGSDRQAHAPIPNVYSVWQAFGWKVIDVDGHDTGDILQALSSAAAARVPTAILARTIKGNGSQYLQNDPLRHHCSALSEEEFREVLEELA